MTKWTCAVVGLLLGLAAPASGQGYYVRPPTNPYFRPQLSPYFTYYYGPGGLGGSAVIPPALARGGVIAPYGPMPGAGLGAQQPEDSGQGSETRSLGNQTGHPTRFMSYSQYFLNQGSSAGGAAPAAGLPAQSFGPTFLGTGSLGRTAQPGARPPRGRENTRPGGR